MAIPGNRHCSNCIGTRSFSIAAFLLQRVATKMTQHRARGRSRCERTFSLCSAIFYTWSWGTIVIRSLPVQHPLVRQPGVNPDLSV